MATYLYTKVDTSRLSALASNIDDSLMSVESALSAVDDSLRNTLQPTWSGRASSQFFTQYFIDAQNSESLMKSLRLLNEQLKQAAGIYDKADIQAGELVNELKIGIEVMRCLTDI